MVPARSIRTVKSVRTVTSAVALLIAVFAGATGPALIGLAHPVCLANHHECGKEPSIRACCCGDAQASQTDSTPVQSRVQVRADFVSLTVVTSAVQVALTPHVLVPVYTSPPHLPSHDLPILFATLLI